MLFVYSIIIWCSYRVYKFIKAQRSALETSTGFLDIEEQLTKTLVAQAVLPVFTVAFPITFIVITVVFPVKLDPIIAGLTGIIFPYIPLVNALSMLLFVKPYQRKGGRIMKIVFIKVFKRNVNTVSTGIQSSTT